MYNLTEGSARGRMPGAGSVGRTMLNYHVQAANSALPEFITARSNAAGTCEGCVNYTGPGTVNGPAGNCGSVCPGSNRILVRR